MLFTERQAQRIDKAVKAVERTDAIVRRNPKPSFLTSANRPAIVMGSVLLFPNRWRYLVAFVDVTWDATLFRWKPGPTAPFKNQQFAAYNSYESRNTATVFGHSTPLTQGNATLAIGPIPVGDEVTILLSPDEGVYQFYAVNPAIAGCNP